ncbi:hypothetical protein B0H13DRAFT_1624304, partial [Mycena leptocephala]
GIAVFYGRVPGVYEDWEVAQPLVSGVSSAIYQGYPTLALAQAAYDYARERGWTRVCPAPPSAQRRSHVVRAMELPTPTGLLDGPNPLHVSSRGRKKWYIVYVGITPGVYQSFLECNLNTSGLRGATHESCTSKVVAVARYQEALAGGRVRVVYPAYTS